MNRPQCSGTLNAQTTQCTQSALCDATADADGSRFDGVQAAWKAHGCDVVPLRRLQRQCTRAADAWTWCKRSKYASATRCGRCNRGRWYTSTRPTARCAAPWRRFPTAATKHVNQRSGHGSRRRLGICEMSAAPAAPAGRLHSRFASRFSWLPWPGHDSGRPRRPLVARNAGSRCTAARRRNGPPRPRRRCNRQRPGSGRH